MSSAISSDTEINSSPIIYRDDAEDISISSKVRKSRQKRPKVVDDENDDVSLWSEAKRQSWASINTNPNAFFYRHCAPGEQKRNGAWDQHEKKLFLETMKVHPPSQGRWGLFAQHIPGRVGYQCRNFYHRLLESGEIKALPEELEKMQRKRKTPVKQTTKYPKIEINEEPEVEQEEMVFSPDEKESSSPSEGEEIVLNQVKSLTFTSQKIDKLKEKGEDLSQASLFSDSTDSQQSDTYDFEVITYLDNDLVKPHDEEPLCPVDLPEKVENEPLNIENQDINLPVENTIKWTPRMKEPWKTLKPEQIEKLKSRNNQEFQYEVSKILKSNFDNPLNLILFSLPTHGYKDGKFINAVRDHLVNDNQSTKNELLRRYFQAEKEGNTEDFVNYVIETARPSNM